MTCDNAYRLQSRAFHVSVYRVDQIKRGQLSFLLVTTDCVHKMLWFLTHINIGGVSLLGLGAKAMSYVWGGGSIEARKAKCWGPKGRVSRTESQWWEASLPRLEAVSRQYFHCLGLGLALNVLILCLETKTVHDTCWKCHQLPSRQISSWQTGKVLGNDQTWGLWPRWIASRLYPPTIPRFVATLLEVMMCDCYFCTGRTYILTKWHHYVTRPGENSDYTFRNVNVVQM